MITRYIRTALIGFALFLILVIGGLLLASRLFNFILFAPRDLSLVVAAPQQTTVGAQVPLQITIANEGEDALNIDHIEISRAYFRAMTVLSSDPPFLTEASSRNWEIYGYAISLAPGQSMDINLTAQAQTVGNYQGELDVCVSDLRCRRVALVTRIEP
ncbi:MAG: hypothetical protein KC418_13605 [Anaerolineales bacterium]|nr:hypothetical protein [Anaerolineales bacterium]MCB8950945.1 hypothetical protein [Ardenticatenales bacterium]